MNRRIMTDVPEMQVHRIADIDLQELCSKPPCQLTGILIGAVCRAKPRHRHCGNRITGKSEQVARLRHHKQCQRGIQPTGNTDDDMPASGMLHPLFQPHSLHHQNFFAAFFPVCHPGRHKWCRIKISGQLRLMNIQMKCDLLITMRIGLK